MEGLLGNPMIDGLLGGGGPMAVRAQAQQQVANMMPRASGGMIAAPSAPAPSNDMAQTIAGLGGNVADAITGIAKKNKMEDETKAEIASLTAYLEKVPDENLRARALPLVATPAGRSIIRNLIGDQLTKDRQVLEGADGVKRYVDTGEQVFPGVKPKAGAMRQAYDRKSGGLVFATDEDIRASGGRLVPAGAKPNAPKEPTLMPVFDKQSGAVTYATAQEVRAERGRYGPVSAAPDGGKYRQRTRAVDDQTQVFEVSFDGGMTWKPEGQPVARSVDPTAALVAGLLGGGPLLDGQGQGGQQPGATQPAAAGPAASAPAAPASAGGAADLTPENVQATLQAARDKIARDPGSRAAVIDQLRQVGIDPGGL